MNKRSISKPLFPEQGLLNRMFYVTKPGFTCFQNALFTGELQPGSGSRACFMQQKKYMPEAFY